jgi:hypothetical protein
MFEEASMAPDLAHQDDAPSSPVGRLILGYLVVIGICAALAAGFYQVVHWLQAQHAGFGTVLAATAVYAAMILGVVGVWMRTKAVKLCMTPTEAARRYRRRMSLASWAYVGALLFAITAYKQLHWTGVLAYGAALLPAVPLIGMFASMALYLREETDEFQRTVQIESSLWATGAVLVLCAGWGFLEMFGMVPHIELWILVPVWAFFLGVANVFIRRRYR